MNEMIPTIYFVRINGVNQWSKRTEIFSFPIFEFDEIYFFYPNLVSELFQDDHEIILVEASLMLLDIINMQ